MNDTCFPKLVYKFILAGRRNVGQPRKRWEEPNTHINEKSLKMAYTLLLMMTPSLVLHLPPHMVPLWRRQHKPEAQMCMLTAHTAAHSYWKTICVFV
jgi:hypothetical protein